MIFLVPSSPTPIIIELINSVAENIIKNPHQTLLRVSKWDYCLLQKSDLHISSHLLTCDNVRWKLSYNIRTYFWPGEDERNPSQRRTVGNSNLWKLKTKGFRAYYPIT